VTVVPVGSRARQVLQAAGWSALYLVFGGVILIVAYTSLVVLERSSHRSAVFGAGTPGPLALLVQGLLELGAFLFATWLIGFKWLKLSRRDLRWAPASEGVPGMGAGLLLGAGAVGLSFPLGGAALVRDAGTLGDYLGRVALTALILAPAALAEEIMFRGLPQIVLGRAISRGWALVVISVLFGCSHLFNPHPSPLAIANIALAGIFLGVAFYAPGGLWTAFGAHLGWNAMLAALDAPVSGLPFRIPFIDYVPGGPDWLTGGSFGPEGGVLASIVIAAAIVVTARWTFKNQETR
jgi:membrane protease YdiL (CAAX protease family)